MDKQDTITWVVDALDEGFALIRSKLTVGWTLDGVEFGGGVSINILANDSRLYGECQISRSTFSQALEALEQYTANNSADEYVARQKRESAQRADDDFFDEEYD